MKFNPFSFICRLCHEIFGAIHWECPPWLQWLKRQGRSHPKALFLSVVVLIGVSVGGYFVYRWYEALPKPELTDAHLSLANGEIESLTAGSSFSHAPLNISFFKAGNQDEVQSAAPLGSVSQVLLQPAIHISPAIKGSWMWVIDDGLSFTPDQPWRADQKYTVTFDKKAVASGIHLTHRSYSFSTPVFSGEVKDFHYQQDDVNPHLQNLTAEIDFTYPVQAQSLNDHIQLTMQSKEKNFLSSGKQSIAFELHFDESKSKAYLRSTGISFTNFPRFAQLVIQSGVQGYNNQSATKTEITAQAAIPDAQTLLQVAGVQAQIIRDKQDIPHQVLIFETSLGVNADAFSKAVHVFLLPKNNPSQQTDTEDDRDDAQYVWHMPGEVTPAILAQATPVVLTPIPAAQAYPRLLSYQFKAPPGRALFIKVDQGLQSFGDFALANSYINIVNVPEYPKEIRFEHNGAILSLGSAPELSVLARGVPAIHFQIARVLPDMLNQLITQTEGDFNNPQFIDRYRFNASNISQIYSEVRNLAGSGPSQVQYTSLDFKKYLANRPGKLGLFLLTANQWDPETKKVGRDISAKRLILITDLAFLVKTNFDDTRDIFVTTISSGQPAAHAHVEVLGKNSLPIFSIETNDQGHAQIPSLKAYQNDKKPIVYRVSLGDDVSFMPYESDADKQNNLRLNYSRFSTEGINDHNQSLMANVFTERGVYRPGEVIHIAAIIKGPYATGVPAGLPVICSLISSNGTQLLKTTLKTDAEGFVSTDYTLSPTADTGSYQILFNLAGKKAGKKEEEADEADEQNNDDEDNTLIGFDNNVDVEQFLPDTLRVHSHFAPATSNAWVAPSQLTALVNVDNLFGVPSAHTDVTGSITLTPEALFFKGFPHYIFTDPYYSDKNEATSQKLNATTTDAQGLAVFTLDLQSFMQASYRLNFEGKASVAGGGRSVSSYANIFVSPRPYFIGYQTDNNLSYLGLHTAAKIRLIAVDPMLKAISLLHLRWTLTRQEEVVTLVKQDDGGFAYQSMKQWKPVQQGSEMNISAQGANVQLFTEQTGDYRWQLLDEKGLVLSQLDYTVTGQSSGNTQLSTQLKVTLNKKEYMPGETIALNIAAPYSGTGLITIERDKVYQYQWFKTKDLQSVQKIVLPKNIKGNAFVNVSFMRDFNSTDIFTNPLSYSVVPITIDPSAQNVQPQLTVPEQMKPGTDLVIHYQTNQPAKMIIYAVDEGILSVTPNFKLSNPLAFFFQKRALEVSTTQIIDQILPKFIRARELSAVGGDGQSENPKTDFNPFKRKEDAPVVYWSGVLSADQQARSVTYHVPDYFDGSLQIAAVAASENAVGSTDKKVIVRNDYVISSNVPTFVAPGDDFIIRATVTNTLDTPVHGSLTIDPHQVLAVLGAAQQTVDLKAKEEKTVSFHVKASDTLGAAAIAFDFENPETKTQLSHANRTFSIRPLSVYQTQLQSGYTADTKGEQAVHSAFYPQYRQLNWQVANTPFVLMSGLQHYLDHLPFASTEQLVSRLFPLLAWNQHPEWPDRPENLINLLQSGITDLRTRQLSEGRFSYWPQDKYAEASPFTTIYALHFLTDVHAAHADDQDETLKAGLNYLQTFVLKTPKNMYDARLLAYAAYVLTRNSVMTTNVLTNLQVYLDKNYPHVWQQDIVSAYMAASYALLQDQATADHLISGYQRGAKAVEENDFYNTESNDAQYLYLLTELFPEQLKRLGGNVFVDLAKTISAGRFSSVSAAFSLLAIEHSTPPAASAHFQLQEILANSAVGQSIQGDNWLNLNFSANAVRLSAKSTVPGFFYQTTQAGFVLPAALKPGNNGLEVHQDYEDAAGKKIDQVQLGDVVTVKVSARSPDQMRDQVALIELLPGGFEWVQNSIEPNDFSFTEAEEDRVNAYGAVGPRIAHFTFKIRAVNKGHYQLPPAYAVAMYDPRVFALGSVGSIDVR